jgi:hypothetical protein
MADQTAIAFGVVTVHQDFTIWALQFNTLQPLRAGSYGQLKIQAFRPPFHYNDVALSNPGQWQK